MEECPSCKKWMRYYDPQSELLKCFNCNFTEKEEYEAHLTRIDCSDKLLLPSQKAFFDSLLRKETEKQP